MNSDGEIKFYDDILKLSVKKQEDFIPIPENDYQEVCGMNRKQRREWYRRNRKK